MNLRKTWLIAKREYLYNFRRRSFLMTAFVVPLITFAGLAIVFSLLQGTLDDTSAYKAIGVVDQAHVLVDPSGAELTTLPAPFQLIMSVDEANAALRAKTLDGYYVLGDKFVNGGTVDVYNRPDLALNEGLNTKFTEMVKKTLAAEIGNPQLTTRLQDPLGKMTLRKVGTTQDLDETALIAGFFVPFIFMMLIFIATMTASQFLVSGVTEEKENRMMELFVTSTRPIEMLWGKIVGMGALGLTQLLIWGVIGLGLSSLRGSFNLGQVLADLQIAPSFFLLLLAYFLLGYLLFGVLMTGLGATADAAQDGRQLSSIVAILSMLPIFFFVNILLEPNGRLAVFFSMFPFTAPLGMILRISSTTVPTEQIILSLGILLVSALVMSWAAARLFRVAMLSYGKRLGLRGIFGAIQHGQQIVFTSHKRKEAQL